MKSDFEFQNVWNRESLFVHASFVTGTSFQVLGKNGEFYTKPSKMYRFNGNSPDFYFELSYDGIHPIRHKFARFIVQLAYIYNDADYMAEWDPSANPSFYFWLNGHLHTKLNRSKALQQDSSQAPGWVRVKIR